MYKLLIMKELEEVMLESIADYFKGAGIIHSNGDLSRNINGIWVRKPSVQTKDFSRKWIEEVSPEEIDDRYFNLDGSKK